MINKKYYSKLELNAQTIVEAISKEDVSTLKECVENISNIIEEVEKDNTIVESTLTNNFGILCEMLDRQMPILIKKDKKMFKECVNIIKNDKNLSSQYAFYNAIKNYSGNDAKTFVNEAMTIFKEMSDANSIKKSNKKFGDFMRGAGLVEEINISEDKTKLYNNCNSLLVNKSTLANVCEKANYTKEIVEYLDKQSASINGGNVDVNAMIESYSSNLSSLNESDQEFVKQIIAAKSPTVEKNKKKLHDSIKNDIIEGINKMLSKEGVSEDDKKELENIKETVSQKEYCNETVVADIAKLLEIRDVILDN